MMTDAPAPTLRFVGKTGDASQYEFTAGDYLDRFIVTHAQCAVDADAVTHAIRAAVKRYREKVAHG